MNWGALKTSVSDWASRGDITTSLLGTFLTLTEERIYNGTANKPGLRVQSMLATDGAFVPGALPAGFLQAERVCRLTGGLKVPLEYRSSDRQALDESVGGAPQTFSIRGNSLILGSTATDTLELLYFAKLATPSADADENAIMLAYPAIYLYGMLIEVATWLRDDQMLAQMTAMFGDAVANAQASDDRARRGNGPLRMVRG